MGGTSVGAIKRWQSVEFRQKMGAIVAARWSDPVYKEWRVGRFREGLKKRGWDKARETNRARSKLAKMFVANAIVGRMDHKVYQFMHYLWVRYGMTLRDYSDLFEKQKGVCAFCGRSAVKNRLHIDHDHATGHVRGLLCLPCNRALGMLEKNIDKVVKYLQPEVASSLDDSSDI